MTALIRPVFALGATEFRVALRNRWVTITVALMALFALVLSAAGSAPTGEVGVDALSVTVASLTSVAGEVERGTLSLTLTYPVSRSGILMGKFAAHLTVLTIAVGAGYGLAAIAALATDPEALTGLPALVRLFWSSILLGAVFLALGYTLSAIARPASPS